MTVRDLLPDDVPALLPLMRAYVVDFYRKPDPGVDAFSWLAHHILDHPDAGHIVVADDQGSLVGFATLYFTFSTVQARRIAIMNDLFVAPAHRRHGVGRALFEQCLRVVRAGGYARMEWQTARDNHVAQAQYDKWGGRRTDWIVYEIR